MRITSDLPGFIKRFFASLVLVSLLAVTPRADARPLGIDVSSYQAGINWTNVAGAGISYAWTKATEGLTYIDAYFAANEMNGKSVGIPMGAYHFAHPEANSPTDEASYFWSEASQYIKGDGKTIMPMLDMEVFTGVVGASSYSDWANQWCDAVVEYAAAAGVSVRPVIYVSACNAGNFDGSVAQWIPSIADYNGEDPQTGTPWSTCSVDDVWGTGMWDNWQYSSSGSVSGISGNVDEDVWNGTSISQLLAGGVAIYYWDPQGTSGANPYTGNMSGSWESNSIWSVTSAGQSPPVAWTEGNAVCFGVHTGKGTLAFTVTMTNDHAVAGLFDGPLTPDSCNVTLTGAGKLNLPPGAQALDVINASDGSLGVLTISNTIGGPGQLTPEGNGQSFLEGTNIYTGGTVLGYSGNGFTGILNFNNGNAFGTGSIIVSNTVYPSSCALVLQGSSAVTVTNPVAALTNSSVNIVGNPAGLTFSGNWNLGSWAFALGQGVAGNLVTISGNVSGSGSFTKFNPAILALTGSNTFSGTVSNLAGTLRVSSIADSGPSALGTGSLALSNGILSYTGSAAATSSRAVNCVNGSAPGIDLPAGNLTLNGAVKATAAFTIAKTGAGALTLGGSADNAFLGMNISNGMVVLNKTSSTSVHGLGVNSSINGGTLQLSGSGGYEIYGGVNLTVNSGVFDMNGQSDAFTSLSLSGTGLGGGGALINSSGSATSVLTCSGGISLAANASIGGAGNLTLASALGGAHALTKIGIGTLKLNAADAYSGGSTIAAGVLEGGISGSIPGNVTNNAGTVQLDNATAMSSGATLTLAASPSADAVNLNFSGTQTVAALYFGSTQKAAGTWAASGAAHNNPAFAGSGVLNVTTGPVSTTVINLTAGSSPSTYGSPLSFTASVSGSSPSGTVQFYVDGALAGPPAALSGGSAVYTTSTIEVAGSPHQVTASYSGDDNNDPSSSTNAVSMTVNPAPSSAALISSQNPSQPGSNVTFTATISSSAGTPSGNVVFLTNGVPFSTNLLSGGSAAAGTSLLPLGTNAIAAVFPAQGDFLGSTNNLNQVVSTAILSQTNVIVSIVNNNDGTFTLNLLGTPQALYYIVTSSNLAFSGASWTPLAGSTNATSATDGTWSIIVNNPAPAFYRSAAVNPSQ